MWTVNVKYSAPILFLAAALAFTGCKPDTATRKGEVIDKSTGVNPVPVVPTNPTGNFDAMQSGITGTVHFKGVAPARIPIDMSMDPACSLAKGENLTEQYLVDHGKLANVFVYVKSGIPPSMAQPNTPPVVLDQKGCRYIPHVIALQQGSSVEFRNSDPTMHNIHTIPSVPGNDAIDISQSPMGTPQTRQFNVPEVMLPVRCNNHPWMNAFINVAPNPFYAVTGADGSFTIKGLPPGTYTLAAVHEKLGEQDIQVTVPSKSTAKAEFTFSMNQ